MDVMRHVAAATTLGLGASLLVLGVTAPTATAASGTFANAGLITLPAGAPGTTSGNASPYPSAISVTGLTGLVTDVDVTLDDVGHTHPDDLDIVLVSPSGDSAVLMSDACGKADVEDVDWTFDDEAATTMPDSPAGVCASSPYKPSSYEADTDVWPPAFPGPHGSTLSRFDGENPLGTWRLYARDDSGEDIGDIESGWSITITTGPSDIDIPGSGTSGDASPYPRTVSVASSSQLVTDVNVVFNGITHSHPDDLDILLVGPTGQSVILMSDACGSYDVANYLWRWDDEAPAVMPDGGSTNVCSSSAHRPTNHGEGDTFGAPAPAGPYGSTLSVFDLLPAGGSWSFYLVDDFDEDSGFLVNAPTLELTQRPRAATRFSAATVSAPEGSAGTVTITRSAAGATAAASVQVTSVSGSAGVGDFTPVDQVVSFAPGDLSETVSLVITDDLADEGAETFKVNLSGATGDASLAAPSSLSVTIPASDGVAPETSYVSKPPRRTTRRSAKIKFVSNEAGTFECKVDRKAWKVCTSPLRLKNLRLGKHKVLVRAVDITGRKDQTPLKIRWTIIPKS